MYAEVLVEIKAKQIDQTFTYRVPEQLQEQIFVGSIVVIPFGKKTLEGYVLSLSKEQPEFKTKEIIALKLKEQVLNEEMMELGKYLQSTTLSSLSSCYAAMLPKAVKAQKGTMIAKKYQTYLVRTEEELPNKITPAQQKVLDALINNKILEQEAKAISKSAVDTLCKKKILKEVKEEQNRYQLPKVEQEAKKQLTKEQKQAVETISASFGKAKTFLLHGVTGSGKTEVYLQLIEEVLKNNQTALVLVPEISLTPQFIERFTMRFPNQIAVLHSHLNDGERYDEWRKIVNQTASIVIGARSAVFAPLTNLGIIFMDEEHSESYKQENNPKYHALGICTERSKYHHCPLVLGSATPSLNSMARALKHRYAYISMKTRAKGSLLPKVTLIDMAEEAKQKHFILSRELEYNIADRLNKKEQIVLLLNRRGYSTVITCSNCGFTYKCPHCDISLTYHKSSNQLRCHYCGYTKYVDSHCPKCQEKSLNYYGVGTEKLEEYLKDVFPTARIIRMDADSTSKKGQLEAITKAFQDYQYDILLGTQMVSKGLDFPKVTLVGILNADTSLNIPDYKSNERSFSLFTQASGRAGRDKTRGEVIIQTYQLNHPILTCVKENNYQKYFTYEMRLRKTLKYPPYYYLVQVKLKSKNHEKLVKEVKKAKTFFTQKLTNSIILGPAPANPFLVNGIYCFELLIKYQKEDQLKVTLKEFDTLYIMNKEITVDMDLNY